ncbi:MAG: hypothetical protein ACRDZR_01235 [Acidimicrobiales bacterium]
MLQVVLQVVDITCQACSERGEDRYRRLLAQVWLSGEGTPVGVSVGRRVNQKSVGKRFLGEEPGRVPVIVSGRTQMRFATDDEPVALRCRGCGERLGSYRPSALAAMAEKRTPPGPGLGVLASGATSAARRSA